MIFWNEPKFGVEELKHVTEVLQSGYVSEGPKTKELEKELAKIVGTKHVIMTTSCTAALYLAIQADKMVVGYKEGSVIIPDLTFVATKNAVELAGLKCETRDVEINDYMLDHCKLNKDTKIIIPVNLLGRNSFVNKIPLDYAYGVICDNAGALGSKVPNGKVGCYSLQGNKIISCGQGGFCATDDDEYAKVIRQQKDFGREDKNENDSVGFNFKFNDILAAVCLGQLTELEDRKHKLIMQKTLYETYLHEYGKFMKFYIGEGEVPLWVEFITDQRDELFDYLKSHDIHCRKPWEAITGLPNAKYYSDNCIWLPNGPGVKISEILKISKLIEEFYTE